MKINIAICDDELIHIKKICEFLPKLKIDIYTSPTIFFETICNGKEYDVIFLDIMMPELDGISLAREIRELNGDVIIVFITSKIEFIQMGYEVKAFRYLLKEQISDGLPKVWKDIEVELADKKDEYFTYEFERQTHQIHYREILYFESSLRIVTIHTKNNLEKFYGKLDDIENHSPLFIRIHKSFLVNRRHIRSISSDMVMLSNGETLPISRKYSANVGVMYR